MLEYENQMLLDSLHEDGLTICAKGLSLDAVFLNIVKVYCDPGNLVFVLGTDRQEEQRIINELHIQGVTPLPRVITSENSVTERENIYAEGGVLFISSRIIVVDLLKKRVPVQHITGFLVCRAHKILESCQDGFALRLYRLENKTGFIKAFSTSAVAFTRGFARVERIMKTLFVRNLYLWPRFHAVVNSTLQKKKPDVIELHLELTHSMLQIQTALFDLVTFVVKEIKRINPSLDMEEVTVENSLLRSFQKVMNLQLDPVWHQLSQTSKQLVSDLKILRHLLLSLTQLDSVRFANVLSAFRTTEYVHRSSGWVLMDVAETLFVTANKRLYDSHEALTNFLSADVAPEENPKWKALSEVLKEIRTSSKEPETVLVLVNHIETCKQIKQYLMKGSKDLLSELYKRYIGSKSVGNKPQIFTEDEVHSDDESFMLSQKLDASTGGSEFEEISKDRVGVEPVVVLQPFKQVDPLPDVLNNLKPKYIVMYDVDMTAIRQIEVYQCKHLEFKLTVYFLMYTAAIDEQAYLSTLRSEKNAFDFLIKEKSTMAIPVEQDGKSGDCPELWRDCPKGESSSRKGGVTSIESNPLVIVDMREFRSELPVLLHRRGIDIVPVTLEVGDYILSPEMCVERKSINDLIGSLNSGRLYQQALSMVRHYSKPMLLIEFDQNKPFDFQGRYYLSKDINSNDITNKLQLLTLHFPKLRIVWSASPYATAQLILELKEGREEPKYDIAAAVGQEESTNDFEKYNSVVKDFISKLPGVTTHNITVLLNNINSLTHLATLTKDQINDILKHPGNAEQLYNALHKDYQTSVKQPSSTRVKSRGFRAINKKKKQ